MRATTVLLLIAVALITAPALPQGDEVPAKQERTKDQAFHDAKLLTDLYAKHKDAFQGIYGGVSVGETTLKQTLALCERDYAKILGLEKDVLPELRPELGRILDLWGKPPTEEERQAEDFDEAEYAFAHSGKIEWAMKMTAANNDVAAARDLPEEFGNVSTYFSRLTRMLSDVGQTRRANGQYLANMVKNGYSPDMIKFYMEGIRVDKLKEAKTILGWALKFDPSNAFAVDRMATIDADIAALAKQIEGDIDARKWAGNADGAPGCGPVGLDFLRSHPNWGKNENGTKVLAVAVRGGWVPGERDIFGRIISWGLPVHVAVSRPDFQAKNRARVYELTLITRQGAPSPPKAPPFASYWVGDSWLIRPAAVPRQ
jgi:hypothetical protein